MKYYMTFFGTGLFIIGYGIAGIIYNILGFKYSGDNIDILMFFPFSSFYNSLIVLLGLCLICYAEMKDRLNELSLLQSELDGYLLRKKILLEEHKTYRESKKQEELPHEEVEVRLINSLLDINDLTFLINQAKDLDFVINEVQIEIAELKRNFWIRLSRVLFYFTFYGIVSLS